VALPPEFKVFGKISPGGRQPGLFFAFQPWNGVGKSHW